MIPPTFEDGSTTMVVQEKEAIQLIKMVTLPLLQRRAVEAAKGVVVKRLDICNVVTATVYTNGHRPNTVEDVTSRWTQGSNWL